MEPKLNHCSLIRDLPINLKVELTQRSDVKGLCHLGGYFASLLMCSTAIVLQPPFWPLLLFPQGVLLVFLFTLSHECTHKTPFASGWLNEGTGHVCGVLIALPFIWFRYYHLAHHKFTNDPELEGGPRPKTWRAWLWYLSGLPYWIGMASVIWKNAFGQIQSPYLPERRHNDMRREARVTLMIYAATLLSLLWTPVLLWLWIVPLVLGQPFLRVYIFAEHGMCPPVANMLENSRTTYTNRLVRFIAWNMPFHAEHHAFPNVPFHQLPQFHKVAQDHLKSTSNGYGAFTSDYLKSLD